MLLTLERAVVVVSFLEVVQTSAVKVWLCHCLVTWSQMNQRSQRELLFENVQTADRSGKSLTDSVCFMSLADRCQCVIKS